MWKECSVFQHAQSGELPQEGADLTAPLFLTLSVTRWWDYGQQRAK